MDKKDFLDILEDYLDGSFSSLKIKDILREYEEIFLQGELDGKSDEDIIRKLGSPKSIAAKLTLKIQNEKEYRCVDKETFSGSSFLKFIKKIGHAVSGSIRHISDHLSGKFSGSAIVNGTVSEGFVKRVLVISDIGVFLIGMPTAVIIMLMLIAIIGFTVGNIAGFVGTFFLFALNFSLAMVTLFISIAWTGITIILWLLFIVLYRWLKDIIIRYISWVKDKRMYLRVKNVPRITEGRDLNE